MKFNSFFKSLVASVLVGMMIGSQYLYGASTSLILLPTTCTNFPLVLPGSVKVTQIILLSTNNASATAWFFDAPTSTNLLYTNAAYTNITSYATNYVATYTNYYGVVNSWTNIALIEASNAVAAFTTNYPMRIALTAPTNGATRVDQVNYYFSSGLQVTNPTAGIETITITYQQ